MTDIVFNISKGKVNALVERVANNDPANSAIVVVMLKTAAADATLQDFGTLSALLAGTSVEANFTNYARKVLTDSDLTAPAADNTNNRMEAAHPDLVYTAPGGTLDNTVVKVVFCYDPDTTAGDDTALIPLTANGQNITTDGNDFTVNAGSFYRAS